VRTVKLGNIDNFIVISDVHLRDPNDDITKIFINTLDKLIHEKKENITKIDALFLLGDIFDFITVSKNFFLNLWKEVFNKFLELRTEGVSIYFIEGNHDFGFEHFHSKKLDQYFTDYGDFIIEFNHHKMGTVVLRHGDNVVCAPTYHKPRAFFKSYLFQKIANLFFAGWMMHFICTRYAKKSRDRGEYNALQASFLSQCIENYLNSYKDTFRKNLNTLFIGHIHVLIDTVFKNTHFLVGPDWFLAPSYLVCSKDGMTNRIFCTEKTVSQFDMSSDKL
jgi:UDP-2,3-diacylglucosamine hydrolase